METTRLEVWGFLLVLYDCSDTSHDWDMQLSLETTQVDLLPKSIQIFCPCQTPHQYFPFITCMCILSPLLFLLIFFKQPEDQGERTRAREEAAGRLQSLFLLLANMSDQLILLGSCSNKQDQQKIILYCNCLIFLPIERGPSSPIRFFKKNFKAFQLMTSPFLL